MALGPETKYLNRSGGAALVCLAGSGRDGQGMILSLDEIEPTTMIDVAAIRIRYEGVSLHLNERSRRLFAANEAQTAGRGGLAAVYEATGIARSTIGRGLSDLRNAHGPLIGRIRRPGGAGANPRPKQNPASLRRLEALYHPRSAAIP